MNSKWMMYWNTSTFQYFHDSLFVGQGRALAWLLYWETEQSILCKVLLLFILFRHVCNHIFVIRYISINHKSNTLMIIFFWTDFKGNNSWNWDFLIKLAQLSFKIKDCNILVSFQVFVSYNNEEEELRTKMVDNLKTALRTQPMRLVHNYFIWFLKNMFL